MPKNYCIMQIWAESGKSALPICNYSQILYQFLTFTQNLKRSRLKKWAYSRKLFAICHFQPICVYKLPPRYYSQGLAKFIKLDKQDVHHQCHTVCSLNNGWQDNLPCQGSYLSSYRSPLERHQVLRHENRG